MEAGDAGVRIPLSLRGVHTSSTTPLGQEDPRLPHHRGNSTCNKPKATTFRKENQLVYVAKATKRTYNQKTGYS